ncbi:MAG: ABC transporter ATP-binding protein [Oscillospiraceae bacterium]|jgi:ATP-binding cassette subfamily B protein|nr:ABC transporter ATP-binding protein [Oscillospiraceae bacterium]
MFKSLFRFMKLMGSRLPIYLAAIVLSTFGAGLRRVANSYLIKNIVTAAQTRNTENIIPLALGNFAVFLFGLFLWRTGIIRYNIEGKTAAGKVEKLVFSKAMRLPMSYYEQNHSSGFMSRLVFDTQKAADIYTSRLRRLLDAMISVVIYLVPMLYFSWELTLCLVALCILDASINILFARPLKTAGRKLSDANNRVTEKLTSILSGMDLIKIFPVGASLSREYDQASGEYFRIQKRSNRLSAGTESLGCLFDLTGPLAFLGLGIWFVSMGKIGLGELSALYSLYGSTRDSFWGIGMYLPQMMNCIGNAEKIFEFLDQEEEPEQWPFSAEPDDRAEADVMLSVRDVDFAYTGGRKVLERFSMDVKKGSFTAITGESGSGKSTLAKLLLGFYPLEHGSISVNGKPYSDITLKEVREQIAYVPQEPYLYETTIAENIAYGRQGADREEIIKAAKAANAHDFIMKLPDGYDTLLGERGNTLSGGERQRIAIARAIIRNTPVILMDEATSALDNESETLVQESIKALRSGRTIIMIAHRPSSIAAADAVVQVGR